MKTRKTVFEKIKTGLEEAIEYESGRGQARVRRRKIDVAPLPHYEGKTIKKIRDKLNLSQKIFADILGVSIKTVEAWESGKSVPNGSAQRMLSIIQKDSKSLEKYELILANK